ncbi:hypothetical protein D9756_001317 [Leucocoprinus leucothites]|uniref:MFS general substrate transporter n=1 Tax=Leucocoprinus leucothites TaxID=201217 RepID=A0A8H5G4G3_9AGAR|nr:hypothetical protein D9756_001317 [Leucoagaricus leucothites]
MPQPSTSGRGALADQAYTGQAEELILPEGFSEQTAELLEEFVHPHQHDARATEDTLTGEEWSDEDEREKMRNLPWWKRPTPWWLICALPFTAIAMASTLAPRIEVYTILACRLLRPDIYHDESLSVLDLTSTLAPTRGQLCAADPVVQAAVAKFAAAMSTSMGVLSCLTTGWWGAFSDRYGRNRVMGISLLGLLLTDFNFIFVLHYPDLVPGGYWFLLFGPLVEGSLGGFTGGVAAIHAYQADVTTGDNRSRIFSLGLGLMFTGIAIGPTLGSLLIRSTGHILSVFYGAMVVHVLYAILIWFILPQSLSLSYRLRARETYARRKRQGASERTDRLSVRALLLFKRLFSFLAPLAVFAPVIQEASNPLKKQKRDWNLTIIGAAYMITISVMGSYNYTFQYAAATFGWTSEILGYWLSLVGAARAVFLALILPVVIKLLKPEPIVIEIPQTASESTPLLSSSDTPRDVPTKKKELHSPAFDLGLTRVSVAIEAIAYTCMGLAPTALAFTVFGMVNSIGTAFSPAIQSATLALYMQRGNKESGKLFGALSVLQALGSQILGPSLYGFVYVKTVATYPRTIFFVSVITFVISSLLLACVRLPKTPFPNTAKAVNAEADPEEPDAESRGMNAGGRDSTLVEVDA